VLRLELVQEHGVILAIFDVSAEVVDTVLKVSIRV
jgi:hypothetical protein